MRYGLLLIALLSLFFLGCDRCDRIDCNNDVELRFRLTDDSREDLVFGEEAPYPPETLRATDQSGNELSLRWESAFEPPFLAVPISEGIETIYLRAGERTIELDINYTLANDECCGKFINDYALRANGRDVCLTCPFGMIQTVIIN